MKTEVVDNKTIITHDGHTLIIPISRFGDLNVTYDGAKIPCSALWDMIGLFLARGKQIPPDILFEEGRRAAVYQQHVMPIVVYTTTSLEDDIHADGNIWIRREMQRKRTLVDQFKVRIAKADEGITPDVMRALFAFMKEHQFFPVGFADDRLYFSQDPEAVFNAFGSRDWLRIGIYLRRPSATSTSVVL